MNGPQILANGLFAAFFLVAPMVLFLRRRAGMLAWLLTTLISVMLGWGLIVGAAMAGETPDGGAAKVLALYFDWVYALVWLLLCFLVIRRVALIQRLVLSPMKTRRSV